jgi:hypothetical protein
MPQAENDRNEDSGIHKRVEASGVLESTRQVAVLRNRGGNETATLGKCTADSAEVFDDGVECAVTNWTTLRWTHWACMMKLEGAPMSFLLPLNVYILRGKHRSIANPSPGVDDVCLVEILRNPSNLPAALILSRLMK